MTVKPSFDIEVVSRLTSGDEAALSQIYYQYWDLLYKSAYRILGDHDQCADAVQEVFVKLWNMREQLEIRVSLQAYLLASVRYEVFRHIRHSKVHEDIFTFAEQLSDPSRVDMVEYKELNVEILAAIDQLPDRCREVFKLSRVDYLSHKEIAARLSISTKTVEYHIANGLRFLRTKLTDFVSICLLFFWE